MCSVFETRGVSEAIDATGLLAYASGQNEEETGVVQLTRVLRLDGRTSSVHAAQAEDGRSGIVSSAYADKRSSLCLPTIRDPDLRDHRAFRNRILSTIPDSACKIDLPGKGDRCIDQFRSSEQRERANTIRAAARIGRQSEPSAFSFVGGSHREFDPFLA